MEPLAAAAISEAALGLIAQIEGRILASGPAAVGTVEREPGPEAVGTVEREPGPAAVGIVEGEPGPAAVGTVEGEPGPAAVGTVEREPGPAAVGTVEREPGPAVPETAACLVVTRTPPHLPAASVSLTAIHSRRLIAAPVAVSLAAAQNHLVKRCLPGLVVCPMASEHSPLAAGRTALAEGPAGSATSPSSDSFHIPGERNQVGVASSPAFLEVGSLLQGGQGALTHCQEAQP